MIIDILLIVVMFICAFLGFKKGFIRTLVAMLKGIVSLIIAIIVSKPIAAFFDKLFGLGKTIGKLFTSTIGALSSDAWFTTPAEVPATAAEINLVKGNDFVSTILEKIARNILSGAGDNLIGNTPLDYICTALGFFALIVITAILAFIVVRILLRLFDNLIVKMTENNTGFSVDAWLGAAFGIIRYFITIISWMVFLVVLSSVPFMKDITQWLFSGSVICSWLYEITGNLVIWFFETFDIVSIVVNALGLG